MNIHHRLLTALFLTLIGSTQGKAAVPEQVITEPVSVQQYEDAIMIYLHGFDVMRTRYPALELKYRLIAADGIPEAEKSIDLTQPWEKPAILLRKEPTEYSGILVSAMNGTEVFFRRLYTLDGTENAPTLVSLSDENAAIELGQFMTEAPEIPHPDRSKFEELTVGDAERSFDINANTLQVRSNINYPQVSSGQLGALSRQTDFPNDPSKRSLYVPLKSQFFN